MSTFLCGSGGRADGDFVCHDPWRNKIAIMLIKTCRTARSDVIGVLASDRAGSRAVGLASGFVPLGTDKWT